MVNTRHSVSRWGAFVKNKFWSISPNTNAFFKSVIDLEGELISKPQNREEAFDILKKLNGKKHYLVSSVCISKNGAMIWNYTDKAALKMKNFSDHNLKQYLSFGLEQISQMQILYNEHLVDYLKL